MNYHKLINFWTLAGQLRESPISSVVTDNKFITVKKGAIEVDFWFTEDLTKIEHMHCYIINDRKALEDIFLTEEEAIEILTGERKYEIEE